MLQERLEVSEREVVRVCSTALYYIISLGVRATLDPSGRGRITRTRAEDPKSEARKRDPNRVWVEASG